MKSRFLPFMLGLLLIPTLLSYSPHNFAENNSAEYAAKQSSTAVFKTSCSATNQPSFNQAVTLLHSFEYVETRQLFAHMIAQHEDCAMAYWGAAMSIWHPLWAPPSQADLVAGQKLLATAAQLTASPREKHYIDALSLFFSSDDRSTHRLRAGQYAVAMGELYQRYRESDNEATVFYALALLASADPRDKNYPMQYKAGALLNYVQARQPLHPGVLHYSIHAYDFPGLAHLAFDAAKTYAASAKHSAHAQHMPSHIFTRLGDWERSLATNHNAIRSAAAYTAHAKLSGQYDEGLHSMDYSLYAMLQTGRDKQAQALIEELTNIKKTNSENFKVAFTYASSKARYTLERHAWQEASTLTLMHSEFDWPAFPWAQSIHYFARGIGAARIGNNDQAQQALNHIKQLTAALSDNAPLYWQVQVQVQAEAVRSWILFNESKTTAALAQAEKAAELEETVDKHPVTPGEILPARELYADMLLAAKQYAQALQQYQQVLGSSPRRLNSLLGAARAAKKNGDQVLAQHYQSLAKQQSLSDNREIAPL